MRYRIFEFLFFIFTFLSFSATTYSLPWTSSSMEFFAFLAALFLFFSIPYEHQKIIKAPLSLFSFLLVLVSIIYLLIQVTYEKENVWMISLYILFFYIYSNSIYLKSESFYLKLFFTVLLCGLFNSFVIYSQYFSIFSSELNIWIAEYSEIEGRPYGNFGQPNLVATLLLTSLCSCIYLYKKKQLHKTTLLITSVFFGCTLAFPSSKTSFLCLIILITFSLIFKEKFISLILTTTAAATWITKSLTAHTRDLTNTDISTGRFELWLTMLDGFLQKPWFGYGPLNTRVAHFHARELDLTPHNQVIGSSHNLIIDFFIWFGILFGAALSLFLIIIIIKYFIKNTKSPENIYLALPLIIHSQLEFPLFYANFLFLFAFIINRKTSATEYIEAKKTIYGIVFIGMGMLYLTTNEYIKISQRFTDLRFYNQNFINSEKPAPINLLFLDTTGGQYNSFLKEKIVSEQEFKEIISLTKSMPSLHNYSIIINYLIKNKYPQSDLDFWMKKARASFSEPELRTLEHQVSVRMPE